MAGDEPENVWVWAFGYCTFKGFRLATKGLYRFYVGVYKDI